jgi:hypothetical protein
MLCDFLESKEKKLLQQIKWHLEADAPYNTASCENKYENSENLNVIRAIKNIWLNKENWNILKESHKNNTISAVSSSVPLFTQTAGGTGRWKMPADDMEHTRYTSNNYGEMPAAVVSRRGLFLEPDSSGVSRFMWSLFFWEFWNILTFSLPAQVASFEFSASNSIYQQQCKFAEQQEWNCTVCTRERL